MRSHPLILTGAGILSLTAALGFALALPAATAAPTVMLTAAGVSAATGGSPMDTTSPPATGGPTSAASPTADPGATLAQIKQRGAAAIATREAALPQMAADVSDSLGITAADKATLLGQIQADESGLNALNATIQADTTVAAARADVEDIVTDYYVFALEAPKVHLVIAGDAENSVESLLAGAMPEIQAAINASNSSEKAAAQAAFDDCTAKLAAAHEASSGVSAEVIDLQPSGYPGNKSTLEAAHTAVTTARSDLQDCRQDLTSIRKDLTA
jgi:hypothetical protein